MRSTGLPVVTALIVAGALAASLLPGADAPLVYDRDRVLAGEAWRLLTGHLVHFSPSHAGWDLAVFALAGGWLECRNRVTYLRLFMLTAVASGLWFLAAMPDMTRYGGLSGLASAAVVALALRGLREDPNGRPLWAATLLLFAAKVCYELVTGEAAFAVPGATRFEVVPSVHVIGALAAVVLFSWPGARRDPPLTVQSATADPPAAADRVREA